MSDLSYGLSRIFVISSLIIMSVLACYNFYAYSGNMHMGGDPEIHVIFARNFLDGYFLEFNPGHKTSGETSVLYMMIVASLMTFFTDENILFAMSGLSLLACFGFFSLLYRYSVNKLFGILICLYVATVPSIFFQAWLGMENIIFALFSVFVTKIYVLDFSAENKNLKMKMVAAPLIFLSGFMLRPEFVFVLFGFLLFYLHKRDFKWVFVVLVSIILCFGTLTSLEMILGVPIHGAGSLRAQISLNNSISLELFSHTLQVNKKVGYYFISSFPFLIILLIATFGKNERQNLYTNQSGFSYFFLPAIGLPIILHAFNILPNVHFSRYQLYFYFLTALYTVVSLNITKVNTKMIVILFLICGSAVWWWETDKRNYKFSRALTQIKIGQIQESQSKASQKLFSDYLCQSTKVCEESEIISVAAQEVQVRLLLDDRFFVASLDGITDYQLVNFVDQTGCFNHFDYMKFRKVKIIFEFPDYAPKNIRCTQSLQNIEKTLKLGKPYEGNGFRVLPLKMRDGLWFDKINKIYGVVEYF